MWFKNLTIFRLTESFLLSTEELEQKLATLAFHHCGPHEEFSLGWTSPLGKSGQQLTHSSNGFIMLCGKKEERVLPSAVINELVQEKISEKEDQQARKLSKKERTEIKDEIIFDSLPKAFTFSRKIYLYIDPKDGYVIVDSASAKSAEDILSLLRKSLGSLPAIPLNTINKPSTVMTDWLLTQQVPSGITIEDECELRSPEESGSIIRCKRHDLSLPEIKNHLDSGKEAIKLAVSWEERLSFIIDENLAIKRLRFLELIQDQVSDIEVNDAAAQFDVDFSIMSAELANFIPRLLDLFGGEIQA
ncbi:MAG: recombination-associated protein RdgC [Methylococcales bacterium]|nr:recombination-associated protein RdgC [Methylococcales bacterium]